MEKNNTPGGKWTKLLESIFLQTVASAKKVEAWHSIHQLAIAALEYGSPQ
jgi:hypothetical protein